jgi:pimeloyl-ACP methyl ester carboxylesterase
MSLRNKAIIFVILAAFSACKKEEFNDVVLTSHKLVRSYYSGNIGASLNIYSTLYPEIADIIAEVDFSVKVYTIEYRTTFEGQEVIASGLVSVPDASGSFPVISFQNGTNSCHSNAPSVNYSSQLYSLLNMMSSNGYIIAMTDYLGFGASDNMLHPYYHKESTTQAVSDMIRAVDELVNNHLKPDHNGNLFLMGYSQGGWATLASLSSMEIEPPASMSIMAASCGAGAYYLTDYAVTVLESETFPNPFYFPYFIEGRIENGLSEISLPLCFNEPYASAIPNLFDGTLCNDEINENLTESIAALFTPEIITNFEEGAEFASLRYELEEASVIPWKINKPILLAHSNGDESVHYAQSIQMRDGLITAGTNEELISFLTFEDLLHNEAILPWGIATITWFNSFNSR